MSGFTSFSIVALREKAFFFIEILPAYRALSGNFL